MATETRVLTNLTAGEKASFERLNAQLCVFNGYDKPRYFDKTGRAGYLGLEDWTDSSFKLTGVAAVTGTLGENKWFSVVAVPVDTSYSDVNGRNRQGNPTTASNAVQAVGSGQKITWTLTLAHPQNTLNDTPVASADKVDLYCSQASPSATLAETGTKYFIGQINNTLGATLEMTADPTTSVDAAETDNFQPPTLRHAVALNDRIFGIVGVREARGQIKWDTAAARFEGQSFGPFTISSIADQGNDIWRYSFSGSPDLSSVTTSMRMSCTGATSSDNDVSLATVVTVSDASDYLDVRNPDGVAQAGAAGTCTAYDSFIADGFIGAKFKFENDGIAQEYTIATLDVDGQYFTASEGAYNGAIAADTFTDFEITTSDKKLWWSKVDDPNSWPTLNVIQFEEDLTAVSTAGEYLAVFSLTSVYIVNPRNPVEFRKTLSPVGTPARFSPVHTENGVYFYDGNRFRVFDGRTSSEFTSRRVDQFLKDTNDTLASTVHGTYIPSSRSIRWFISYVDSATLNYWVEYSLSTGFWWFGRGMDVSCSTVIEEPTTGETVLYTGTSARYADRGFINKWADSLTDGQDAATTTIWGTITNIIDSANQLSFSIDNTLAVSTNDIGTPFQAINSTGTRDIGGVIETIVDNGAGNYTITYHDDFDLSAVIVGDWIILGVPSFRWGIKWFDFDSPQYSHELKEIQIHVTPGAFTWGLVDFYTDYSPTPNKTVAFSFASGETKRVVRYHGARGHQVGYKVRAWSQGEFEIKDKVIVHRAIV